MKMKIVAFVAGCIAAGFAFAAASDTQSGFEGGSGWPPHAFVLESPHAH